MRHVELHHLRRARRRILSPQSLDEVVGRHRAPAWRASIASTARCLRGPSSIGPSSRRTSTGPRSRRSTVRDPTRGPVIRGTRAVDSSVDRA